MLKAQPFTTTNGMVKYSYNDQICVMSIVDGLETKLDTEMTKARYTLSVGFRVFAFSHHFTVLT